jgi:hypothetical protein
MQAIRITQKLSSDTLHLPELRAWIGQDVEIIVLASAFPSPAEGRASRPLAGSVLCDDDPFGPAVPSDDWEANR